MNITAAVVSLAVLSLLPGCIFVAKTDRPPAGFTAADGTRKSPGLRETRRDDLAALNPGDSVEAVRRRFPEAVFIESRSASGHRWDAYSVVVEEQRTGAEPRVNVAWKDELWFFFEDGQYRGFGSAGTWPSAAAQ